MIDRLCRMPRRYFSDRLDGVAIPGWRGLIVRGHLAFCPGCIRYQRALEATRAALADLRDPDAPGGKDPGERR